MQGNKVPEARHASSVQAPEANNVEDLFSQLKIKDNQPLPEPTYYLMNNASRKSKKFYVITTGWRTGIFDDWLVAQKAHQGYHGASCKAYETIEEVREAWYRQWDLTDPAAESPQLLARSGSKATVRAPMVQPEPPVTAASDIAALGNRQGIAQPAEASSRSPVKREAPVLRSYRVAGSKGDGAYNQGYWVVLYGERPGVYLERSDAIEIGIGGGAGSFRHFGTREEANETFVREYMAGKVIATPE